MNAMARMAVSENAAVKRAWGSELDVSSREDTGKTMDEILSDVCSEIRFSPEQIRALSGKVSGFKAMARKEAIVIMSASRHSDADISEYFGMLKRSVQAVIRQG